MSAASSIGLLCCCSAGCRLSLLLANVSVGLSLLSSCPVKSVSVNEGPISSQGGICSCSSS